MLTCIDLPEGVVERLVDVASVCEYGGSLVLQEVVEVHQEPLLPAHADRVAVDVVGVHDGAHQGDARDHVVDDHQEDGEPCLAEQVGLLGLADQEVPGQ